MKVNDFLERYRRLEKKYQIIVEEIEKREIDFSRLKKLNTILDCESREFKKDTVFVAPNLTVHNRCIEMYDYSKNLTSIFCIQNELNEDEQKEILDRDGRYRYGR